MTGLNEDYVLFIGPQIFAIKTEGKSRDKSAYACDVKIVTIANNYRV